MVAYLQQLRQNASSVLQRALMLSRVSMVVCIQVWPGPSGCMRYACSASLSQGPPRSASQNNCSVTLFGAAC
jgi:hypothetical protein